ncbi:unnamed protein product [Leptidea sinapis]|uniref:Uncharacterized protein n=1 Tax=Leptidea sinapis TaxID=189913 RepID=A0A5E4QA04_9NEOP|nr:unnamed protein product [Leptidea sinapis]
MPTVINDDKIFIAAEATEIELNAEKEPEADTTSTPSIAEISQRTLTFQPTVTSQNSKKPKPTVTKKKKITIKRSQKTKKADEEGRLTFFVSFSEDEDTKCLYCHGLYFESTEGWITCYACGEWAHCGCAGVEDNDDKAVHILTTFKYSIFHLTQGGTPSCHLLVE